MGQAYQADGISRAEELLVKEKEGQRLLKYFRSDAFICRLEIDRNIVYLFLFFCIKFMAEYTDMFYDKIKKTGKTHRRI